MCAHNGCTVQLITLSGAVLLQVTWTKGSVLFASGSPFLAICYDGCEPLQPAQANNAYIFPAVGHAAVLTKCTRIPNEVHTCFPHPCCSWSLLWCFTAWSILCFN